MLDPRLAPVGMGLGDKNLGCWRGGSGWTTFYLLFTQSQLCGASQPSWSSLIPMSLWAWLPPPAIKPEEPWVPGGQETSLCW